jgi:hypothetical protein
MRKGGKAKATNPHERESIPPELSADIYKSDRMTLVVVLLPRDTSSSSTTICKLSKRNTINKALKCMRADHESTRRANQRSQVLPVLDSAVASYCSLETEVSHSSHSTTRPLESSVEGRGVSGER